MTPLPDPTGVDADDAYEFAVDAGSLTAGAEMPLTFRITQGGESAEELEPYLGALGHLVALREGDFAYLHVHPTGCTTGQQIGLHVAFPSMGQYRLFLHLLTRSEPLRQHSLWRSRHETRRPGT